jgi:hypothetical protein
MKTKRHFSALTTLAATASIFVSSTFAAIVYDNSVSFQNTYFGSASEFGDQIDLVGPERIINSFKFDYFLGSTFSGNETVVLRLYNNSGLNGAPSEMLFESPPIGITTGYNTITANDLDITVQDTLTWTVLFGGIDPFESAGLLIYDPPAIGKSFDDYWEKTPTGTWNLKRFENDPLLTVANFGAQVSAVPEPGTIQLALVGGLIWLASAAKRRYIGKK